MVDLGTLEIGLKLDKANVEKDIKDIRKELEALYELTETNNIAIKPKVNHDPLTSLNKHLDKKVKHLKEVKNYFNSNPIKVSYEEDETGSKKKKKAKKGGGTQSGQEDDKNNNWETKLANALEQAFNKSIATGVNALLDGLPGPIRSIVANPLVGFIQGAMFSTADRTIQTMLNGIKQHIARQKGQTTATPRPDEEWLGRNVLTGEPIMPNIKRQGTSSQSVSQAIPDPWDENDPLPTVEVIGKGQDSSQEKKQRTVVVEEVQDDKSKPSIAPGYNVKADGTISSISTQNTFKALATEIRKLNSRIVPAPVQTLTHGLQGTEVGNLTSAIVALQTSIDSLNDRFAQLSGSGEITGGLSIIPSSSTDIVSIDDLIDPSPIQMTATVISNVTGGLQKFGRGVQAVGTFVGNTISPLYRMAAAIEDITLSALPYGHLGKKMIQGAAPIALGAGAMHLLPGGVGSGLVHVAQSGLSPLTGMGASAISGMVADVVAGLPLGIGNAISANVAGLLAGGAETVANIGGAGLAMGFLGKGIQNVASLPFKGVDKDKFQPNPIMITPAYEPVAMIAGGGNASGQTGKGKGKGNILPGTSHTQPSLPNSVSGITVGEINAGQVKGEQLALPSKSGGVNYDVHGLDQVKSEQDLVDYLSPQNKIKNAQGKNVQLFELDGLRRLAQALAGINGESIKNNLNRKDTVSYITKQELSQVMSLLAQNPSRYYNPKASVPTQVVNPTADAIKQPDNQKQIVAQVKSGAKEVTGQFNSAKNLGELQQALVSYQRYVKGISDLRINLTPTRDLNGVLSGLKTSIEKSVVEVAKGIDQGLGKNIGLDTAIGVLQRETPELAQAVKTILKMSSPSKVFMQIGGFVSEGLEKGIDFSKAKQKIARQSIDLINTAKNVLKISSPAETFAYIGQMIVLGLEKGLTFDEIKATIPQEVRSIIKDIDTIINDIDASRLQGVKKGDLITNAKTKLLNSFNTNAVNPDVSLQKIAEQILAFRHHTSAKGLELLLQGSRVPGANGVPGLLRPTEKAFAQRQGLNVQNNKLNQAGVMPPVHNAIVLQNTPNMAGSTWSYGQVGIQFKKNQQGWMSQAMGDSGLGTQINQMPFTQSGSIDFDKLLELTLKNLQYEGKKNGGQSYLESHWWGEQNPDIESLYLANEKGRFTHKGSSGADELQKAYKAAAQAVRQGIPAFYEFLPKSKTGDWGDWGNNATPQWQQLSAEAFDLLGSGMSYDDMIAKLGEKAFGNLPIPDNDTATKPVAQKIVKKVADEVRKNVAQTPPPDASYKVATPAVNQVKPQQKDFVSVHSSTTAQPTPQTINASSRRRKRGSTASVQQPIVTMDNYDPWLDDAMVDDFDPVLPDSSYVDKRRKKRGYSNLPYTPEPEEQPIKGRRNRGFSGGGAIVLYEEPVNYINPSSSRFGRRKRGYSQSEVVSENNRFGRRRRGYSQENYETELDNEIPIGQRRKVRSSRGMREVEPTGQYRFVSPDDLWYDGQEEEIPAPDASYIHQIQGRRKKAVRGVVTRKQRTPKTVVTPSKYSGYSFSPRVEMPTPIPFDFSTYTPYTPPVQSVKQDIKQESENVSKFNNLKQPFMEAVKARDYDSVINMLKTLGGNNKNVLELEKFLGDSGLLKNSKNIGKNVATSVGTGVTQSLGDVKSAGEKIGKTLDNSTKTVLGIASPSKVFKWIGENVIQGLVLGLSSTKPVEALMRLNKQMTNVNFDNIEPPRLGIEGAIVSRMGISETAQAQIQAQVQRKEELENVPISIQGTNVVTPMFDPNQTPIQDVPTLEASLEDARRQARETAERIKAEQRQKLERRRQAEINRQNQARARRDEAIADRTSGMRFGYNAFLMPLLEQRPKRRTSADLNPIEKTVRYIKKEYAKNNRALIDKFGISLIEAVRKTVLYSFGVGATAIVGGVPASLGLIGGIGGLELINNQKDSIGSWLSNSFAKAKEIPQRIKDNLQARKQQKELAKEQKLRDKFIADRAKTGLPMDEESVNFAYDLYKRYIYTPPKSFGTALREDLGTMGNNIRSIPQRIGNNLKARKEQKAREKELVKERKLREKVIVNRVKKGFPIDSFSVDRAVAVEKAFANINQPKSIVTSIKQNYEVLQKEIDKAKQKIVDQVNSVKDFTKEFVPFIDILIRPSKYLGVEQQIKIDNKESVDRAFSKFNLYRLGVIKNVNDTKKSLTDFVTNNVQAVKENFGKFYNKRKQEKELAKERKLREKFITDRARKGLPVDSASIDRAVAVEKAFSGINKTKPISATIKENFAIAQQGYNKLTKSIENIKQDFVDQFNDLKKVGQIIDAFIRPNKYLSVEQQIKLDNQQSIDKAFSKFNLYRLGVIKNINDARKSLNNFVYNASDNLEKFGVITETFTGSNPVSSGLKAMGGFGKKIATGDIGTSIQNQYNNLKSQAQGAINVIGESIKNTQNSIGTWFNNLVKSVTDTNKAVKKGTTKPLTRKSALPVQPISLDTFNNDPYAVYDAIQPKPAPTIDLLDPTGEALAYEKAKEEERKRIEASTKARANQANQVPSPTASYNTQGKRQGRLTAMENELGKALGRNDFQRAIAILEILAKIDKSYADELAQVKQYQSKFNANKGQKVQGSLLYDQYGNRPNPNAQLVGITQGQQILNANGRPISATGQVLDINGRPINNNNLLSIPQPQHKPQPQLILPSQPLPNASYTPPSQPRPQPPRLPVQSISSDTFNTDPYAVYDNNATEVINDTVKRLNDALIQAFASGDIEEATRILQELSVYDDKYLSELEKLRLVVRQRQEKIRKETERQQKEAQLTASLPVQTTATGKKARNPKHQETYSAFANAEIDPVTGMIKPQATRATMATGTEQRIDPVTGLPYNVTTRGRRTNQTQAIDSGDRVLTTPVSESALSEQFELALERGNLDEAKQLGEQLLSLDSRYVAKYKELEQAYKAGDVDKIAKIIKEIAQLDNKYLTKVKEIEKAQKLRNAQTQNASFVVPTPSANPNRPVDTVIVNGSGGESQPPNPPTASYADDGNQSRNFFNRLWNRLTGNIPPRPPVTPPTETSGGDVPLDSSLTVIPNNVKQSEDEPFVPFGGSKKFSIANLNTGGGIKSSDTDSLMAQARRLGRDLTRAMNLGLEDNGGFQAKIRYQVEQVKAQIQRLKELETQLQATSKRIEALNYRQESRGQRQETLQGEIKALQESLPNTPVGDRDQIKAQIASKEKELLGVINEEKKVADKLLAEKKKEQDLQTVINRERQEIFNKEKEIRKELDNEIAQDSAVFREMEDQKNRAGVEQVVRKVKDGIPDTDINGNPQNKDEFIGQVAGFGASAAIAFAPLSGLLTLAPVVAKLIPTITALTGAFNMIAPIFRNVAQNIEKLSSLQNRFNAISTDPREKGKEFDYVKGISNRLGLSTEVLSTEYTKLYTAARGTKLQGAELKQLFEGVAASVRTLNLTTYESELVFNAYAQMLSKGKISMEELRQQLGEKFPPAMGIFARSLGVSTAELDSLVSKGAVLSDDILSKVGKQLKVEYEPIVGNVGDSYMASLNRFKNAVMDLNIKLVNEFEGLFIALNNVMAFGVRTVDKSFESLKQFFLTSVIGVTAVLAVGSTVIMNTPFIQKYVSGFMSLFTQTLNRGMTALMPFVAGIGVDLLPFLFGSDMKPMDHMTHGIWNIVEAMVSLAQVKPEGDSPLGGFVAGIVDMAKNVGKALGDLRKWLSGPIQLVGLVLMFEQMTVLGKMYVIPTLDSIRASMMRLFYTMRDGITSGKNWKAMLKEIAPVALATKGAVLALEAGLAILLMAFARGDLANPLQDSFVKLKASARDLWKALEPLTKLKINPEVNIPELSGFPDMGIETNVWAMFGQKDKSVLSDEVISKAAPVSAIESALLNNEVLKFAEGWGTLGLGKLVNFTSSALTAMVGNETDKARFYNYLGVGGGEIQQSQRDALTKRGLEKHLPANNRETYGLRTTVNQFQFIEALQKELNDQIKASGFERENIAQTIKNMEANTTNIIAEQAKPILRDSGLSEDKQKEILDIKTIEGLDDRRKTLGAKRADLAVINTPEALEEIRAIDMELRAIEGVRKNVVIEVSTMVDGLDSNKKLYENFMEEIDGLMVSPDIKIQMKKEVQKMLDEIDRIKQALEDAGLYDKLKPLEDVFKRITTEILRMNNAYEKFLITGGEKVAQKRINLLESGIAPEVLPIEMSNINLQWDTEKLTDLNNRLAKAQALFKELSAIAIPAEGDPRSEQKKNLQEQIKQMRNERMELANSIAQQRYDINQNAIRRTIALRNFDRSVVDLQIQVDSAIRQRAVELRNIIRQQDDLVTQNTIAVRNIYQSYRDLQIQLERRSVELNSQLQQSRNNIDRLIFNINTNQLVGYGSGLGSRLATISERLSQINADFANATENLKLQELDAEQQSLQITRQIRDLREQAYTIELQRRRQLQDLATTQETFVRNQANTWLQIQRRTEDMKDEADRMGTNFTTIGKTIGDMNDLYLGIHENLKETADKINSRPITIDDVGAKGTTSTVPPYPKLPSVVTPPPTSTSTTIKIANGSSLTLPNGVKPVVQNSTLKIPMGTVLTQNGARYSIPSNATLNLPQGVTPNINGATVNIPQGTTLTLPPNKGLTVIPYSPPSSNPVTVMPRAGKSVNVLADSDELNKYFDNEKQRILASQAMFTLSPSRWDLSNVPTPSNVTQEDRTKAMDLLNTLNSEIGQGLIFVADDMGNILGLKIRGELIELITKEKQFKGDNVIYSAPTNNPYFDKVMTEIKKLLKIETLPNRPTRNGRNPHSFNYLKEEFDEVMATIVDINKQFNKTEKLLANNNIQGLQFGIGVIATELAQRLPNVPVIQNINQTQTKPNPKVMELFNNPADSTPITPNSTGEMRDIEQNIPSINQEEIKEVSAKLSSRNAALVNLQRILINSRENEELYKWIKELQNVAKEYNRLGQEIQDKAIAHVRQMKRFNLTLAEVEANMLGFTPLYLEPDLARMRKGQEIDDKIDALKDYLLKMEREFDTSTVDLLEVYRSQLYDILKGSEDLVGDLFATISDPLELAEKAIDRIQNQLKVTTNPLQIKKLNARLATLVESRNAIAKVIIYNDQISEQGKDYANLKNQVQFLEENKETMVGKSGEQSEMSARQKVSGEMSKIYELLGNAFMQDPSSANYAQANVALQQAKLIALRSEKEQLLNPDNFSSLLESNRRLFGSTDNDDETLRALIEQAFVSRQKKILFETSGYNEMKQEFGQLADMMNSIGGQLNQRGDLLKGNWLTSSGQSLQAKIQANDMRVNLARLKETTKMTEEQFNSLSNAVNDFEKNALAKLAVDNNFIVSGLVDPMKNAINSFSTIFIDKSKSFWQKVNDIMTNFWTGIANHFANNFSTAVTTLITEKLAQWLSWGVNTSTNALDVATATALNSAGIKLDASSWMLDEASRSQTLAAWELAQAAAKLNASLGAPEGQKSGGGIGGSILQSAIGAFMQPIASLGFGSIVPDTGALSNTLTTNVPSVADYTTGFTAGGRYAIADDVKIKGWGNYAKGGLVDIENFAKGGLVEQAQKALAKERMLGGGKAVLSALTVGEYVVPKNPNRKDIANLFASVPMARNMQIENYAKGGMVGKASSMGSMVTNNSRMETRDNSFVSNIYVNANDVGSFRKTRYQLEMEENARLARSARRF